MKVYCKKTFSYYHKNDLPYLNVKVDVFIEGKIYDCDKYDNMMPNESFYVYLENTGKLTFIKFKKYVDIGYVDEYLFSDYFYTKKELRKNKLEKINENR